MNLDQRGAVFVGNLGPIPLYIHWTFIFLLLMLFRWSGIGSDIGSIAMYAIVVLSGIVLHELGHGFMARALGAFGVKITLWAFGGLCSSTRDRLPRREILILAAGPAVSFLLAWGGWIGKEMTETAIRSGQMSAMGMGGTLWEFCYLTFVVNLGIGIFNITPIFPLDGGQIVFNAVSIVARPSTVARLTLSIGLATALAYLAYDMQRRNGPPDLYLILLLGYLQVQAFQYLR